MTDKITVQAVYEDGVFKPLERLQLSEKQVVKLEIELPTQESNIVQLKGVLTPYLTGDAPTLEEIEALTSESHAQSLDRLLHQINGDFTEDDTNIE